MDKLDDQAERDWYVTAAVQHGWSRNVLLNQIMNRLHARAGAAPSNFPDQLPAADSGLAQQLTRDPYVLDFLDLTAPVAERDLETALVDRLQAFLLELGHGFAFVDRQYHFEVDGDDFYIDLLFFNWAQSRFVVLELKIGRFAPEHLGRAALGWPRARAASSLPDGLDMASRIRRDAADLTAPTLFHVQWHDELFPREGQLDLFDLLGSQDKQLIAYTGSHGETRPTAVLAWCDFISVHLRPAASDLDRKA